MLMRDEPSPVVSLTLVDGASVDGGVLGLGSRVLVVARAPAANRTHPGVVSVPTQRVPHALHEAMLQTAAVAATDTPAGVTFLLGEPVDSAADNGHHPVVYAVESLLTRKLGLPDGLELDTVRFRAALATRVVGTAVYDNLGPRDIYEPISMLNVLVELVTGQDAVPLRTATCSLVGWTTVNRFIHGVESRKVEDIAPGFDPIELCVHGVCLDAAVACVRHRLGAPLFSDGVGRVDPQQRRPTSLVEQDAQRPRERS